MDRLLRPRSTSNVYRWVYGSFEMRQLHLHTSISQYDVSPFTDILCIVKRCVDVAYNKYVTNYTGRGTEKI